MGAQSYRRGRRGEQWIEKTTGAVRVRNRPRYVKAPDFAPLRLANGETLQFESKHGASVVPKKIRAALDQAASYSPSCIAVAIFRNVGDSDGVACLSLRALCRLLGVDDAAERDPQLALGRTR